MRFILGMMVALFAVMAKPLLAQPASDALPQVFLIQNSGWMEPFYSDPQSRFRVLVGALIAQSAPVGSPIVVATFNRSGQAPGIESPQVIYAGPNDPKLVRERIADISIPRKPGGAYVDSDFEEALGKGATRLLRGRPGVIWFVSNNQNAPDGISDGWQNRSEAFTRLLMEAPQFSRVYAHPVRNEVESVQFGRREGFIFYAIAYGKRAGPILDELVAKAGMRTVLGSPLARLRPLDRLTTRFVIDGASQSLSSERDWIKISGDGAAKTLRLKGRVENRLYPFVIRKARLDLAFRVAPSQPGLETLRVSADTRALANVPALGRSGPVTITLELPAVPIEGLMTTERRASGVLTLQLSDIDYEWDRDFLDRLSAIPASGVLSEKAQTQLVASQLPQVFVEPLKVRTSRSDVRLQLIVQRSLWWLWLVIPAMAVGAFALWQRSGQPKKRSSHIVDLGGERKEIKIASGEKLLLSNSSGERFTVKGRGTKAPMVTRSP
ncbi:hypothetical protein [Sandarakinorhabdus sp.]|uniref:hypothetical protein n=1 Tax=Sandarakinorhabdus sp. TaxID=1916663 RepID=UPI003F708412